MQQRSQTDLNLELLDHQAALFKMIYQLIKSLKC